MPLDEFGRMNGKDDPPPKHAAPPRRVDDDETEDFRDRRRSYYYSGNGNGNGNGYGNGHGASRSTIAWIASAGSIIAIIIAVSAIMQMFVAPLTTRLEDHMHSIGREIDRVGEHIKSVDQRVRELERNDQGGR